MTALGPSRHDRPSHGLWDLREMLELKAGAFLAVMTNLASLSSWIEATSEYAGKEHHFHEDNRLHEAERDHLRGQLQSLKDHLTTMEADVTLIAVDELLERAHWQLTTWGHVKERLREIGNTLRREVSTKTLLVLEPKEQAYFAPKEPHFGGAVAAKFLSAAFDIDEASKCFALGRSTASVFHLMRVMEIGIRATARCLGIPDPIKPAERNWGHILGEIRKDLDAHGGAAPTKAWAVAGDKEFFEGAYASLDAVRVAWRNTTMHVENKYTTDEAEHIWSAVKGFITKLASRCDEKGVPKA